MRTVDEQMEHRSTTMKREPQIGFDTLTTLCDYSTTANLFLSRMYYVYHFENDFDAKPVSTPPQICPVALLTFSQFTKMPTGLEIHYAIVIYVTHIMRQAMVSQAFQLSEL